MGSTQGGQGSMVTIGTIKTKGVRPSPGTVTEVVASDLRVPEGRLNPLCAESDRAEESEEDAEQEPFHVLL